MSPADIPLHRFPPGWRWVTEPFWRIERAFRRAKAEDRAEDDTRLRIFFVLALFSAAFLTLAVGATRSALFSDNDRGGAEGAPPGARAELTDRNGQLLAVDLPHFGLYYDPHENWNPDEVRRVLGAALPGLSADRLDRALKADRRQYLIGGLTPADKDRIDDLGLPGLSFQPEPKRAYLMGPTAGQLIGFVDRGGVGISGAELALDRTIRADAGKTSVPLSIDLRVQAALQDEVEKAGTNFRALDAIGIVTDVKTGEILGMASWPDFDPNAIGATPPADMINHVTSTVYEPGSVFKVFTLAMGIDSGIANINTVFDTTTPLQIGNQKIRDDEKSAVNLPLWQVFTHSSNIGAARLGLMAGGGRLQTYFKSFGLYAAAPSELKESARPLVASKLTDNTVASMSFGQAISVTPLAVATGMNAIFNDGVYIPLTIRKLGAGEIPQGRRVVSEQTSRTMLDLMRLNATLGTGRGADQAAPGYSVGGKTGTAQKAINGHYAVGKRVSSFAAIFPTDGPMDAQRYFVFILLDEPNPTKDTGGFAMGAQTAAPTAGRVIERIAPILGVKREAVVPVVAPPNAPSDQ
ncbi:MAG TPA: penicillin-binding protein 2 [Caulobacteraceae bacterium]|jgi:cell division protein FtsI (penicillin-binding protein 3)|nr:penicillin-binding protein 2 [Caulobacteraceae bacterium]